MISGVGEKAFCAGGDMKTLHNIGKGPEGSDKSRLSDFPAYEYLLDYAMANVKSSEISIWNGVVMGGGVGLSSHAPFRIATDNTLWAMPETGIGFFADVGASYYLPR